MYSFNLGLCQADSTYTLYKNFHVLTLKSAQKLPKIATSFCQIFVHITTHCAVRREDSASLENWLGPGGRGRDGSLPLNIGGSGGGGRAWPAHPGTATICTVSRQIRANLNITTQEIVFHLMRTSTRIFVLTQADVKPSLTFPRADTINAYFPDFLSLYQHRNERGSSQSSKISWYCIVGN